jgi:hypothetical protein
MLLNELEIEIVQESAPRDICTIKLKIQFLFHNKTEISLSPCPEKALLKVLLRGEDFENLCKIQNFELEIDVVCFLENGWMGGN